MKIKITTRTLILFFIVVIIIGALLIIAYRNMFGVGLIGVGAIAINIVLKKVKEAERE